MTFLFLLSFFLLNPFSAMASGIDSLIESKELNLSKGDHIIGEHMVNMLKFVEKGYVNQDILKKVLNETEKSKHFSVFHPWLKEIKQISSLSTTADFYTSCNAYLERKQNLPLERVLERIAGNFCRERALEAISREIDKTKTLTDEATHFIQQNLKFFLTKKNKKSFAFFIQTQSSRPDILKKISQEVTSYSVQHEIIPSQEVLKDILINEQITKLIQDKGFNPLQHKNVFYTEYGKLIESGYKILNNTPKDSQVKEHYLYLKNFLDLNQDHLPMGLCLTRLNDFAKAVFRNNFKDLSRDIFKFIIKKNNKEIHEDALFFYLWTYLSTNETKEAYKIANSYNLIKKSKDILDPRLKYWIAHLHVELDQSKDAITLYEDLVFNHSLSFYAILATKKLQVLKQDSKAVTFYTSNSVKNSSPSVIKLTELGEDYISSLVRLKAWSKIDSARMLKLELKRINNHSMPEFMVKTPTEKQLYLKSDLHILNARIIQSSQNFLSAFRYLYQALDKKEVIFNRELLEILYPKPYFEVVTKELKNNSLDPIVLLSLIRQESVFNPQARSPVGARGLMQLMPNTAKRLKRSVRTDHLVNPKTNIELGTKYFSGLMKRYEGNLVFVLSAYNAGESRVERWKGLYFEPEENIVKNIEAIPFLETRNYVKLIFRNIFFYKLLANEKNELVDPKELNKIFDISLGFKK